MVKRMHIPRKRFGQNFLHDQGVIQQILAALQVEAGDLFVEIGPGQGALTEPLLKTGNRLDVVELDRDLVGLLKSRFSSYSNLKIYSADALKFDFSTLSEAGEKLRVIGNLPYNISTPLMFHLLENACCIQDMLFMLQKEVVDRICAAPGNKQYGRLGIMMQYYCSAEWLFDVSPESFHPPPKVLSSIVRLKPHQTPPVQLDDLDKFGELLALAFSQRRKTVRNALKKVIDESDFPMLSIDPNLRPENLTLADFAKLSNLARSK